jgi:hypothetical protein
VITDAQLTARITRQSADVARVTREAGRLVKDKLADSRAHALAALTETLKDTPEGRPTIARARRSRSYLAALNRLVELQADLVELIGNAREAFYRASFAEWAALMPDGVLRSPDPEPALDRIARCRAVVWHGTTLQGQIKAPTDAARRRLLSALAVAARRDQPERDAASLLTTWGRQAEKAIGMAAALAVNDSWGLADRMSGRDVVKAELLHDDPTLPD